jgi:adenine-specific DNA-methyltransferase
MAETNATTQDYTKLKLPELLQLCKDRGLKGCSGNKKAALIKLLSSTSSTAVSESEFVLQPMITYIGNKRKLVPWIMEVVEEISAEFSDKKLNILDGFAGSGVVSRALMPFCSQLHSNDMELYSFILLKCFLETPSLEQRERIDRHFLEMDKLCQNPTEIGFVSKLYSPKNTYAPTANERVFYTRENAMIIDTLLKYISGVNEDIRHYLLGPLIIKASINVNTAGVFRGFYKKDGIGHFGGVGENALERILAPIRPEMPLWSSSNCKSTCYNSDINNLITTFEDGSLDLIYLDPPYNEHPYGSNYFMLNLIAKGQEPTEFSKVSGIPKMWNKSAFNGRGSAYDTMLDLLRNCLKKAKYTLISYNNEGLVTEEDWTTIFRDLGCKVKKYEKEYDTYHGSRNLNSRNKKVVEIMYLLQKSA